MRRHPLIAAIAACAGCASTSGLREKPVSIVEVNRNFSHYEGRVVTLEGDVGTQNEQPEIWTSVLNAAHMFGAPRAENCVRLDLTGLAGEGLPLGHKQRLTGTVVSAEHLPKAWGIACPSKTALRVTKVVSASPN